MKSDIEIARSIKLKPISEIAESVGILRETWNLMEKTWQKFRSH